MEDIGSKWHNSSWKGGGAGEQQADACGHSFIPLGWQDGDLDEIAICKIGT